MLLSNSSSSSSSSTARVSRKEDVLDENEVLPRENTILSFHAELPALIATSSSSSRHNRLKEAEDFLQLLKRKKESNLNNLIIQQTQVSLDQFNLSLGDKSPQQAHQQPIGDPSVASELGAVDGVFRDISSSVLKRSDADDGKVYTLNLEMAVQVVEQIMCICRGNKVEDFDVKGGLRLSTLSAVSDREGEIKEKIHISLTTNDKKDYTTLTEQAEAPIQISKEFVTVMEYGCKDNFRPELVRSRCRIENSDKMVKVSIQLAFNQQMPNPIEKCEILASLNAFGEVIEAKSKHGVYDSTKKIMSWTSATLDIVKCASLQLDVEVHVPATLPKVPSNVPVVVKGFYSNALLTGVSANITSITYGLYSDKVVFTEKLNRRTKLEFRLL